MLLVLLSGRLYPFRILVVVMVVVVVVVVCQLRGKVCGGSLACNCSCVLRP